MKIGIIGGGMVGQTFGAALAAKGHDVVLGIRNPTAAELAKERTYTQTLADWHAQTGIKVISMTEAAAHGEVVVNATAGMASIAALTLAGADHLSGKVVLDISNPLDFSKGFPAFLAAEYSTPESLGEKIQAAFPTARIVKGFNTIASPVMVDATLVPGDHDLFIAGNDAAAKATVTDIAKAFGWTSIIDLGDITGARASESLLPTWIRLWQTLGTPQFNIKVVRA